MATNPLFQQKVAQIQTLLAQTENLLQALVQPFVRATARKLANEQPSSPDAIEEIVRKGWLGVGYRSICTAFIQKLFALDSLTVQLHAEENNLTLSSVTLQRLRTEEFESRTTPLANLQQIEYGVLSQTLVWPLRSGLNEFLQNEKPDENQLTLWLQNKLTGNESQSGLVALLANELRNAAARYDAELQNVVAKQYGLTSWRYYGEVDAKTRPQCSRWVDKGVLHAHDLEYEIAWAKENGHGLHVETTPQNFALLRGGYNCRHAVFPIRADSQPFIVSPPPPPPAQPPTLRAVWTYEEWLAKDQQAKLEKRLWEANGKRQSIGDVVKDLLTSQTYIFLPDEKGLGQWQSYIDDATTIKPNPLFDEIFNAPYVPRQNWAESTGFPDGFWDCVYNKFNQTVKTEVSWTDIQSYFLGGAAQNIIATDKILRIVASCMEFSPAQAGTLNGLGTLLNDLVQLLKLPEQLAPYLPEILKFLQDEVRLVIQVTGSQTQTADLLSQIWENRAALIQLLKDEVRETFENYEQLLRQSDPDEREYLVARYGSQLLSELLVAVFTAGGGTVLKNGAKILRQITKYLAKRDLKSVWVLLKRLARNYRLEPTINTGLNPKSIRRIAPKGFKKLKSTVKISVKGKKDVELEWFYSSTKKLYIFANGSTKKSIKDILRQDFRKIFLEEAAEKVKKGMWNATEDWIAHHLIPLEMMDDEIVQKAVRYNKKRFHLNQKENGMALKRTGVDPTHTDGHKAYNEAIKAFLKKWNADNLDASPQECSELLDRLMIHLRKKIDANPNINIKNLNLELETLK